MSAWNLLTETRDGFGWEKSSRVSLPSFNRTGYEDDCVGDDHGGNVDAVGPSVSLFKTASGKSVSISSAGLARANSLFEKGEVNGRSNSNGFKPPRVKEEVNGRSDSKGFKPPQRTINNNSGSSNKATLLHNKPCVSDFGGLAGGKSINGVVNPKSPAVKFQTAGGRTLSVSSDALERARRLLGEQDSGDVFNDGCIVESPASCSKQKMLDDADCLSPCARGFSSSFTHPGAVKSNQVMKNFASRIESAPNQLRTSFNAQNVLSQTNLINKFDAVGSKGTSVLNGSTPPARQVLSNGSCGFAGSPSRGPLADISNATSISYLSDKQGHGQKRKLGLQRSSVSPFKKPRSSKIITTSNQNASFAPSGLSTSLSASSYCKRVSTRYPPATPRMYIREYFGPRISEGRLSGHQRGIKVDTADKYLFNNEYGKQSIGAESFQQMLAESGASIQHASIRWVRNHYRWLVWKLACYDRYDSEKVTPKFLTVTNVLEELKYRYEREFNKGHRSAIMRILVGDASPSSMVVLCISATQVGCGTNSESYSITLNDRERRKSRIIVLTDGWYSMAAVLDEPLSAQLNSGKMCIGQKLRICGARLSGWAGPVSPLEASESVSLLLHMNGTYRTHWADRLGFRSGALIPLAFRCIKSNGGSVPMTLVGLKRKYPVLYMEKLNNGRIVVRSERTEAKAIESYNQRRSVVVEGVVSEFQSRTMVDMYDDEDCEETRTLKLLEKSEEPDVIMADMPAELLFALSSYQSKLKAKIESDKEKAIEKALNDAGLGPREVTPFMRVRVNGLTNYWGKNIPQEGLITIWNPTEQQQMYLTEGQAYTVSGLAPLKTDSNTICLQARGSSTEWKSLSIEAIKCYQPFFCARIPTRLLNIREVPLKNEFDIAAYVVYVGEAFLQGRQMKQWVFLTDGSVSTLRSGGFWNSLLAISFCSPFVDGDESFDPINYNLTGSTVAFCNIIKKERDYKNHMWVAEATENSTYFLNLDSVDCAHLKQPAISALNWGKNSGLVINKLREKVLLAIGYSRGS